MNVSSKFCEIVCTLVNVSFIINRQKAPRDLLAQSS
jgi:hypothetical protein